MSHIFVQFELNFLIIWNRLFQIFLVWCIGTICPNLNFDKYRWADLIWLLFLLLLLLYNPNVNVDRWWVWSKSNWTRQREKERDEQSNGLSTSDTHSKHTNEAAVLLCFFIFYMPTNFTLSFTSTSLGWMNTSLTALLFNYHPNPNPSRASSLLSLFLFFSPPLSLSLFLSFFLSFFFSLWIGWIFIVLLKDQPWKPEAPDMNCPQDWPEPIVRVQSLSDSGVAVIPDQYIKPSMERPEGFSENTQTNIPVIDLEGLFDDQHGLMLNSSIIELIYQACREWGFFQVVNHGVSPDLMDQAREVWRDFFNLPMEMKQVYANSPKTYEGYGSRLGVEKGAILDWSDYYFLHYRPSSLKDHNKWPSPPLALR